MAVAQTLDDNAYLGYPSGGGQMTDYVYQETDWKAYKHMHDVIDDPVDMAMRDECFA